MGPWSRKSGEAGTEGTTPDADGVDDAVALDGDEHAWWAQRDVGQAWAPRPRPDPADTAAAPERDVLAEHFGPDWRTSFGFDRRDDPPPVADAEPEPGGADLVGEVDTSDPYAVLAVEPSASWEEIVAAHRALARRHHPDRVVGRPAAEVAAAEDRIRVINTAYAELRVRRGR